MIAPLLAWFNDHKRSFPWRKNTDPYAILVSEVMLQQTQAARVVEYFLRWMQQFPSIHILATAPEGAVIKAWEGLGYYSRARALHACAQTICSNFGGTVPSKREDLLKLPGIGPYTAGAIAAFAFHQHAAAVDANVRRVMNRMVKGFFEEGSDETVQKMLPTKEPYIAMEALIELGALVCTKRPNCSQCPCKDYCYAYSTGQVEKFTHVHTSARISLWRDVAILLHQDKVLVQKPTQRSLMKGLYEFPYTESKPGGTNPKALVRKLSTKMSSFITILSSLPEERHSFTKYYAHLYPTIYCIACSCTPPDGCEWIPIHKLDSLPFSSGHRRVVQKFLNMLST